MVSIDVRLCLVLAWTGAARLMTDLLSPRFMLRTGLIDSKLAIAAGALVRRFWRAEISQYRGGATDMLLISGLRYHEATGFRFPPILAFAAFSISISKREYRAGVFFASRPAADWRDGRRDISCSSVPSWRWRHGAAIMGGDFQYRHKTSLMNYADLVA